MPAPRHPVSPRLLCLTAALSLAACDIPTLGLSGAPLPLLGDSIAVAGPQGYCVDPQATRETADTAVVLIGRCTFALTVAPAVLSLSIGPPGSAGVLAAGGPLLTDYFTSIEGRRALSRAGRAEDVAVIEARGSGDAYLLHLQDRATGSYWRGVVGVKGRLVTLTANGTPDAPLAPETGRALIDAAIATLRRAN